MLIRIKDTFFLRALNEYSYQLLVWIILKNKTVGLPETVDAYKNSIVFALLGICKTNYTLGLLAIYVLPSLQ